MEKEPRLPANGRSLADLLTEVCARRDDLVLYERTPKVHDYDEKHLLVERISCVDADGNITESYPQLLVMKDVFRNKKGRIMFFTSYQAIIHCEQEGYFLPTSQETSAIVAALNKKRDNPQAHKVLVQYKYNNPGNGWHAQNTVIDYGAQKIIHYPVDADFPSHGGTANLNASCPTIELPFKKKAGVFPFTNKKLETMTLEEGLNHPLVSAFVKQFTGLADPSVLVEVGKYFQKPAKVWFPTSPIKVEDRTETRAAWFGCSSSYLNLDGSFSLRGDYAGRGVKLVTP